MLNNIQEISDNYLCSNCGACVFVCPKNAIHFRTSNIGRLYPVVNDSCIACGKCKKICPSLDLLRLHQRNKDKYVGEILKVYIGRTTDSDLYLNAQSGGVCTAILYYLFDTKKIDAALVCKMNSKGEAEILTVTKKEKLRECQKSIYTPVPLLSVLSQIQKFSSVAVVGLPCHIQGIVSLSEHRYIRNIKYKLGLICDKTLCAGISDVVITLANLKTAKILWKAKGLQNGKFYPYQTAPIVVQDKDRSVVLPRYYRIRLKQFFTSPRCYVCYDKLNTFSDIVLGDPWGCKGVDWKTGDSLILLRTKEGEEIFSEMATKQYVNIKSEVEINNVLAGQYIEERRKSVTTYSEALSKLISTNSYLCNQRDYEEISEKKLIESNDIIKTFIKRESLEKNEIIKQARNIIRRAVIKQKINTNIFIRIIRRLINEIRTFWS